MLAASEAAVEAACCGRAEGLQGGRGSPVKGGPTPGLEMLEAWGPQWIVFAFGVSPPPGEGTGRDPRAQRPPGDSVARTISASW